MKKTVQLTLVVTFYTTAAVMEMERLCAAAGIEGRIFPVPRSLTSDCGMAWRMAVEDRDRLNDLIADHAVEIEGMHEIML